MAKGGNRGLPSNFTLGVSQDAMRPVELGDYLDEESPRPAARRVEKRPEPPAEHNDRVVQFAQRETLRAPVIEKSVVASHEEPTEVDEQRHSFPKARRPVARMQVNMDGETVRMVDELLAQIQRYSGQKDAKASEMFNALVAALFEARELLEFSDVQARGKWGTPTARAFPTSLKTVFQRAIAQRFKQSRGPRI